LALLKKRNNLQPIGLPSCGSVFKNPPNHHAAKLIQESNLKGFCIGNACVSDKHANFIINQGKATASDIEHLIKHIQQTVKSNFNIDLETEVIIIG
jgi:UDP-N-acetylmuramate dehydrogenase